MRIADAVAVVTGGASGLGEASAAKLIEAGARVVIADLQAEQGASVAARLGARASFVPCDVTREAEVQALLASASALGPLRVVVSCAGIALAKRLLDKQGAPHALDVFERVVNVNLVGTFNLVRLAAAEMVARTPLGSEGEGGLRGVIVNTASIAAYDGQLGQAAYAASKGGIVALTLPLARELAQHGIRVCTVCPGVMDTPLMRGLPEAARTTLERMVPLPARLGLSSEFAALVAHIVENDYLNGESIRLDGALRMPPR